MRRRIYLNLMVLLLAAPVLALPGPVHRPAVGPGPLLTVQNADIGANGAARVVRQATAGRILAVRRVRTDRGPAYRVKVLLAGGRVRIVLVDAASGALR